MSAPSTTDTSRPLVKRRDVFFGLTILLAGLLFLVLGSMVTRKAAYGSLDGAQIALSIALVSLALVGTCWAFEKHTGFKKQIKSMTGAGGGDGEMGIPPQMMQGGMPPAEVAGNRDVVRLCMIVASISEFLVPEWDKFEFEEGELIGYGFRSLKPGFLATESSKNRVDAQLASSLGEGWGISYDSRHDTFIGSKKSTVPKMALPEMWNVIQSKEEAARRFNDFEVFIGVGEDGPISFKPKQIPHKMLVGATGGGKSVAARAEIIQFLAAGGYRLFACDGKSTDYSSFMRFPNVSAVSTSLHEHIILIHKVWMILQARRSSAAAKSKAGDMSWRESMTPILLIIDEWASVRSNMVATFKDLKLIDRDISELLKVGREFRVNVIIASQGTEAKTTPTDWFAQLPVVQSLGRPDNMTVNKAFPEDIQGEVRRLGGKISRKVPGRALVSVTNEDGNTYAALYQAYWSYSPAETITDNLPKEVRANWSRFKEQVVDRIPRMYPREWVKLEYPAPPEGKKDPFAEDRESGWVDITKFSVEELHKLRPVALEDPDTFAAIPENAIYDPLSDAYIGEAPLGASGESDIIDV